MTEMFYRAAGAVLAPFRYAQREAQTVKEHLKEDFQVIVASMIKIGVLAIAAMLFLLFISIGVANLINAGMDSAWAGYAIVAGFYLLIAGVMWILKTSADKKRKEEENAKKERELDQARKVVHAH